VTFILQWRILQHDNYRNTNLHPVIKNDSKWWTISGVTEWIDSSVLMQGK